MLANVESVQIKILSLLNGRVLPMKYNPNHVEYLNSFGIEVPSATTVLKILNKPFLTKWANIMGFKRRNIDDILNQTSNIGNIVHAVIYSYLMNYFHIWIGTDYEREVAIRHLDKFITWKKAREIEPIFMEKQFVSDLFGGTTDFYGLVDGKLTILDFKTSKKVYSSMFLQLAAYCIMLEAEGFKVEQVGIVLVNETKCTSKIVDRTYIDRYIPIFKALVELFHKWYDINIEDDWGSILGS